MDLDQQIAVVGLDAQSHGASDIKALWHLVRSGKSAGRKLSTRELLRSGVSRESIEDPDFVPVSCSIEKSGYFDSSFFGFTAREADITDPQRRLLLQSVYKALERAAEIPGQTRTGTFL